MPKIVDHQARKEKIAEAMWQVILEQGMEGATARNIAKQAGLSLGALRYYFKSQDELLIFAMKLVKSRAAARIDNVLKLDLPLKEKIIALMLEIVPTTEETRAEMEVWYAFTAYLQPRKTEINLESDGIFEGMQHVIRNLAEAQILRDGLDIALEIERLYALIDGLAIHALLEPKRLDADRLEQTIRYHLDSICK